MTSSLRAEAPTFVPQVASPDFSSPSDGRGRSRNHPTSSGDKHQKRQGGKKHKKTVNTEKKEETCTKETSRSRRRRRKNSASSNKRESSLVGNRQEEKSRQRRQDQSSTRAEARENHSHHYHEYHGPQQPNGQQIGFENDKYIVDSHQYAHETSTEEELLPTLTSEIVPFPLGLSGAWADTSSLRNDLANPKKEPEPPPEFDATFSSLASKGNLTILKKSKATNQRPTQKVVEYDVSPNHARRDSSQDDEAPLATAYTMPKQRQWNTDKFRHRLWDLLEKRNLEIDKVDQESAEIDDNDSIKDDSSVEYLPPVQLPQPRRLDLVLDDCYADSKFPLHDAIRRGDDRAVRVLLGKGQTATATKMVAEDDSHMDPFQLAVYMDNARILRLLVAAVNTRTINEENRATATCVISRWPPAPCMSALRGQVECLSVFLDASTSNLLAKDARGNTVLHLLCRKKVKTSLLSSCFDRLKADASTSFISRFLCQKNEHGQTALHVAASNGRADLIDLFLGFASLSLLSKILFMQDKKQQTPLLAAVASASTDATMSLLMWSGNNSLAIQKGEATAPSPLLWATRSLHVDMVVLLLDFFHGADKKVELDESLRVAVQLEATGRKRRAQHEIIKHLIASGANPSSEDEATTPCALNLATTRHDTETLRVIMDSVDAYLKSLDSSRRRDPVLQKQPEAYFDGLLARDRGSLCTALRKCLVFVLAQCWKQEDDTKQSSFEDCAILLYEKQTTLDSTGLDELRSAIDRSAGCASSEVFYSAPRSQPVCRLFAHSSKDRLSGPYSHENAEEALLWSVVAMQCSWVSEKERQHFAMVSSFGMDQRITFDVLLTSSDGQTFEANSELLAAKSAKLAAAFRFARMKSDEEVSYLRVPVPADGTLCRLLLQHMYHGSFVANLPEDPVSCCDILLDLAVLAEHLICESVLQECETRLLSSSPRDCRCGICSGPTLLRYGRHWNVCSGPPKYVTTETAVDIMAAADNLENFFIDASYRILVPSSCSGHSQRYFEFRPFQKLRNSVAIACLSGGMDHVFQSNAFQSQVELCSGNADIFKRFFLRCCLEEFASGLKATTADDAEIEDPYLSLGDQVRSNEHIKTV